MASLLNTVCETALPCNILITALPVPIL